MSELADISKYHQLISKRLRPSQLLLDPSNPRINVDVDLDHHFADDEILSESIQKDILKKINQNEYRVSELKKGISQHGFLSGAEPLIVEQVNGSDKYLVLEGNRRTAAVKSLLSAGKDKLPGTVLKTLELVEVKEFRYLENNFHSRDEIVDILLGTIHLTGKVAWGAMEKAHYIFKTYMRELSRTAINEKLHINEECVNKLCDVFNTSKAEIRKSIWVYSVYQQLSKAGYRADAKKFSLIDLAISNRAMRQSYFEMDSSCRFSLLGLERFNTLCIEDGCPVSNPDDFKKLQYVFRSDDPAHLYEIENGGDVDEIYDRVKLEKEESKIFDQLVDILDRLKSLNIAGFAGDEEERRVVLQISNVVRNKLVNLIEETPDDGTEEAGDVTEDWFYPTDVPELLQLGSWQVQELVKEALKSRPNYSCVRERLATLVLKSLEIDTRGSPRAQAVSLLESELGTMVAQGLVQAYSGGKNDRVRLLVD